MHGATGPATDGVKETTTQEFVQEVVAESRVRPVLVQFWASDSGPCQQLKTVLKKVVGLTEGDVFLVTLNVTDHPTIPTQLKIPSIPAVVAFFDSRPVDAIVGMLTEKQASEFVDGLVRKYCKAPSSQATYRTESDDLTSRWASLAQAISQKDVGPIEAFRRIVRQIDSEIISATTNQIRAIDDQKRLAASAIDARRREFKILEEAISSTAQRLGSWLREKAESTVDNVDSPWSFDDFSSGLPREMRDIIVSQTNLTALNSAWGTYAATLRRDVQGYIEARRNGGAASVLFLLIAILGKTAGAIAFVPIAFGIGALVCGATFFFANSVLHRYKYQKLGEFNHAKRLAAVAIEDLKRVAKDCLSQLQDVRANAELDYQGETDKISAAELALRASYASEVRGAARIIQQTRRQISFRGDAFNENSWITWTPVVHASNMIRVGAFSPPTQSIDERLRPSSKIPPVPALLPFARGKGLNLVGGGGSKHQSIDLMHGIAVRLIASIPPGKLRLTLIDPVGLGQNVAPLLALGDHVEELVGGRAWSEQSHIEQRLTDLTQHMETVIQKYLRDEHESIEQYNAKVGHVVEAYRVVLVCDFPVNFTDSAIRRLTSIAQNGPRCGVYPIIITDPSKPLPYGVTADGLMSHCTCFGLQGDKISWPQADPMAWPFTADLAPPTELLRRIVKTHGEQAEAGMRVTVPFGDLLVHTGLGRGNWQDGSFQSSADELSVPLGQYGAQKYHNLVFGRATAHHALVVGQTGSGKSNLLHVLIATLALKYAPDELELYLVDFKQGVEFKLYAETSLPHARVIAIQSEREFGLSVMQGLLAEMNRRGDEFRAAGVPNLADWRKRTGKKLPRILLLVDEFRVFFTADDTIATEATMIIDRLVSQGRAFGIHVVLASQTLAGSFALPRSITDQMAVRIVLQCTEADSRLALADDNPDARLLSRPGEAIYNDKRGLIEGNHKFQVADMGDDDARELIVRKYLEPRIAAWRGERRRPVVFEGHLPAKLEECAPMAIALNARSWGDTPRFVDIWLGEPIALRPPSGARFLRQGGANFLMVMRDESQASNLMKSTILSLAAQLSPAAAGFHIIDMSSADAAWAGGFEQLASALPHRKNVTSRRGLVPTITELGREVDRRLANDATPAPSVFLILFGLHRMADLRQDEGSSWSQPDGQADLRQTFAKILREGPEVGVHTLIWADSQSSVARVLDRRMLGDCARRVVGPMSEQDSLALIDEPKAGRLDKPHRLIRFDEDRPGDLEVFRPYVSSAPDWFVTAARRIAARPA
jgi:thiol-disulfide isomerase/thioredoxin